MKKIKVLLAEDHMIVREGLRALLSLEEDMEVIGEAGNGRQAVELTSRLRPEVVVMDIAMPLLNGMEATRQILHASPAAKVLILSAHSDDAYVGNAIELGAAGFLSKQTAARDLSQAIRKVFHGKNYFSCQSGPRLSRQLDPRAHGGKCKESGKASFLSSREMEILQLIAEGKTNKQSASELSISIKTVEKHRQNLMEKLKIHDTAGLTRYAISTGVIESGTQGRPPIELS